MRAHAELTKLVWPERPFFGDRKRFEDIQTLSADGLGYPGLAVGRYRTNTPLGETTPNPPTAVVMVVVRLNGGTKHQGWCNGRAIDVPARGNGAFNCLDLRDSWSFDIPFAVDSFHAYIPYAAFDDLASSLKIPRLEVFDSPITREHRDEAMHGIAHALLPVLAAPQEAPRLFVDYVLGAMINYIALTYGGLEHSRFETGIGRDGILTFSQERRVTDLLLDDLASDHSLADLAGSCGLSRRHFVRAFRRTKGVTPHRWLLLQRVERAKILLKSGDLSIGAVATRCGFADQRHLTRVFTRVAGMPPDAWQRYLFH